MAKRAIGYIRVSTAEQALAGVSLEAQRARIEAWCQANDCELVAVHMDAGISGSSMDHRHGLLEALAATRRGTVLVVYSLSRLARSTRDTLVIADRLDRAGADLASLSERLDTTGAAGKMMFRMLAVLAEFERDVIAERTATAMRHKQALGEYIGGGAPFGHRLLEGALVTDDGEQAVIQQARELRTSGLSLRGIAGELDRRGFRSRTAKPFAPVQVARMVAVSA